MNAVASIITPPVVDRRKFIGGSDAGAILGLSPWRTAYDVWLDKTTPPVPPDPKREKFFARGKRMEPVVLQMMQDETGIRIATTNQRYIHPAHGFMACEVDAETIEGDNVEIKTVHPFKAKEWGEEDTDQIPPVYTAQAMHGLMVTGRKRCHFGVLIGADDLRTYIVERDEPTIELMIQREVDFWAMVESLTPPPAVTLGDLQKRFGADAGEIMECAEPSVLAALNELVAAKEEATSIEARIEDAKATIQRYMGTAAELRVGGKKVATWKSQVTRRIDTTAFKAAHPDLAEQFTKATASRVFRTY